MNKKYYFIQVLNSCLHLDIKSEPYLHSKSNVTYLESNVLHWKPFKDIEWENCENSKFVAALEMYKNTNDSSLKQICSGILKKKPTNLKDCVENVLGLMNFNQPVQNIIDDFLQELENQLCY